MERLLSETQLKWFQQEIEALEIAFRDELPLTEIPKTQLSSNALDTSTFRKQVVQYIEGQRLPLSKLTQALRKAFYGDNEKHNDHIQPMICDVAKRRFYGPKNGKDEFEFAKFDNESRGPFWFWEIRYINLLPNASKQKAMAARQKRKQMQDRLLALIALIRLSEKEQNLNAQTSTSMRNKIEKAIKNLEKVPDLTFINEKFSDETEFFLNKPGGKRMKKDKDDETEPTFDFYANQKPRDQSPPVSESVRSQKNKQKTLRSYFEKTDNDASPERQDGRFKVAGKPIPSCPENKKSFEKDSSYQLWITRLTFEIGDIEQMDARLMRSVTSDQSRYEFLESCRQIREKQNRYRSVVYGAPASWARQPNITFDFETQCEKQFGVEWKQLDIVSMRDKYFWFIADSDCPPYFGPVPPIPINPSAKNPFQTVPGLDYEVCFDEGWEEPDGESLSVDEEDEEENCEISDEDEAFIVEDGYLSEDECIEAEMEIDETCSNLSEKSIEFDRSRGLEAEFDWGKFENQTKQWIQTGQTSVFTSMTISETSMRTNTFRGDVSMLGSLEAISLSTEKIRPEKIQ